jgi:hypothetical protein
MFISFPTSAIDDAHPRTGRFTSGEFVRTNGKFGGPMTCKPTNWQRSFFGQNGLLGRWQQQTQQQKNTLS